MMSRQMRRIQDQTAAEHARTCASSPSPSIRRTTLRRARRICQALQRRTRTAGTSSPATMPRLNDLGLNGFKLNSVDGSMTHSTRFVLVDGKRRIRGYYITGDDGFMPKLLHDIRQLAERTAHDLRPAHGQRHPERDRRRAAGVGLPADPAQADRHASQGHARPPSPPPACSWSAIWSTTPRSAPYASRARAPSAPSI